MVRGRRHIYGLHEAARIFSKIYPWPYFCYRHSRHVWYRKVVNQRENYDIILSHIIITELLTWLAQFLVNRHIFKVICEAGRLPFILGSSWKSTTSGLGASTAFGEDDVSTTSRGRGSSVENEAASATMAFPKSVYVICVFKLCERFAYYGVDGKIYFLARK